MSTALQHDTVAQAGDDHASVALTEAQSSPGMAELFGLSAVNIGAQMLNFAIVVAILAKFMAKPILGTLRERSRLIAENMEEAARVKDELAAAEKKAKREHARALKEAQAEADELKRVAEERAAALRAQTDAERAELLTATERELALERARLIDDAADMAAERMTNIVAGLLAEADEKTVRASVEKAWRAIERV